MANEVYNINAMRPAFVKMYENGNRGIITKSVCAELGISETYFNWYQKTVSNLFEAVCNYCRLKNSPNVSAEKVDASYEAVYPLWKEMLSTAEQDKLTRELHVSEHDISNLVSFCQTFVNDRNDASRGKEEGFIAHKVWATQPLKQFQKKVEIDLGIRIAQVEVLSDAERDFLSAERKILSKWKKAEKRIDELSANKERLTALMVKVKSDEAKEMLSNQIKDVDDQIALLNEKIANAQKALNDLLNPPAEPAEPSEPTEPAEPKEKKSADAEKKDDAESPMVATRAPEAA